MFKELVPCCATRGLINTLALGEDDKNIRVSVVRRRSRKTRKKPMPHDPGRETGTAETWKRGLVGS